MNHDDYEPTEQELIDLGRTEVLNALTDFLGGQEWYSNELQKWLTEQRVPEPIQPLFGDKTWVPTHQLLLTTGARLYQYLMVQRGAALHYWHNGPRSEPSEWSLRDRVLLHKGEAPLREAYLTALITGKPAQ